MSSPILFSVFTKPWKTKSIEELGEFVRKSGFDGIEFPLRNGYQAEPEDADVSLPRIAEKLSAFELKIFSVASVTDERVFAGCAAARIPTIRIMVGHDMKVNFYEDMLSKQWELEKIQSLCEKYNIHVSVQHHYGPGISNSMELKWFLDKLDPNYFYAVWDSAHSALAGEEPEQALDILWPRLGMVNFKNAYYRPVFEPDESKTVYKRFFTTGTQGLCSWKRASDYLKAKNYNGIVCLTAEYTQEDMVDSYIVKDLKLAKSLF
jgi:sugar phosphate isomerase/epimerase